MINFEPLSKLSLLKKCEDSAKIFAFRRIWTFKKRSESEANALQFSAKRSEANSLRFRNFRNKAKKSENFQGFFSFFKIREILRGFNIRVL